MQIFHVAFPKDLLEPLLFFNYVNDMSGAATNKLLLYADDYAIFNILVTDKCVSNIETILQNELEIVSEWRVDNKNFLCI